MGYARQQRTLSKAAGIIAAKDIFSGKRLLIIFAVLSLEGLANSYRFRQVFGLVGIN
jgi:hypothetical protein